MSFEAVGAALLHISQGVRSLITLVVATCFVLGVWSVYDSGNSPLEAFSRGLEYLGIANEWVTDVSAWMGQREDIAVSIALLLGIAAVATLSRYGHLESASNCYLTIGLVFTVLVQYQLIGLAVVLVVAPTAALLMRGVLGDSYWSSEAWTVAGHLVLLLLYPLLWGVAVATGGPKKSKS